MAIGDDSDGQRQFDRVLNESWPSAAARIPPAPAPIPVTVRIMWRDRGEAKLDAHAIAWTAQHVKITFKQLQLLIGAQATWLHASDVERRT